MSEVQTLKVDLAGDAQDRSYDILIGTGLIDRAGGLIADRLPCRRAFGEGYQGRPPPCSGL